MLRVPGADGTQGNRKEALVESLLGRNEILSGFDEARTGARREIGAKRS